MIEEETLDSRLILPGDADSRLRQRRASGRLWPLKIVTYNIHSAIGRDRQAAPRRIGDVLEEIDADIVALQEVPLGGSQSEDVLAYLAERTGFHSQAGVTMASEPRLYGNGVLSRYPIVASRSIDLSFGVREPRGALDADIDCDGHLLRVVATHLGLSAAERRRQVEQLLEAFATTDMPVVLLGDLNEWFLWGRALRRLVKHFKRTPAPLTFPARFPVFALDRVWVSPARRLVRVTVHKTPAARRASDHLPLVAQIDA